MVEQSAGQCWQFIWQVVPSWRRFTYSLGTVVNCLTLANLIFYISNLIIQKDDVYTRQVICSASSIFQIQYLEHDIDTPVKKLASFNKRYVHK